MRSTTTTYKFTGYRYPVKKSFRCDLCRKRVHRRTTFTGTSNPFTTPPYMDYEQMRERVQPKIDAWLDLVGGLCTACDELFGVD